MDKLPEINVVATKKTRRGVSSISNVSVHVTRRNAPNDYAEVNIRNAGIYWT